MMKLKKLQQGAALLTAILITAVVAILASNIILNQHEWITQTGLADRQNNFQLIANRIQDWGHTAANIRSGTKDPSQLPAWPSFKKQMQGIQVMAKLSDGNTLYNINWLIYPTMDESFARLIHAVDPDVSLEDAFKDAVKLTSALQVSAGAKPSRTQIMQAPEKIDQIPVVGPVLSLLQFRAVNLIDPKIINKLLPYVSVLPADAGINITTGNKTVMQVLLKPSPNADNEWMAYLSCRNAFTRQHPGASAWASCLEQNDGKTFMTDLGASIENANSNDIQKNLSGNRYQQQTELDQQQQGNKPPFKIIIYRSNYAVLNATLNQTDLSSVIHGIFWMPNKVPPTQINSTKVNLFPKVTLVTYERS